MKWKNELSKYSEKKGWKLNLVDLNEGTAGGFKEIIFEINGQNVYGTLKYESGVHRVQRVPQTEDWEVGTNASDDEEVEVYLDS